MNYTILESRIEAAWENRLLLKENAFAESVQQVIAALDQGQLRVAEKRNGSWSVNEWVKKAVLLYFSVQQMQKISVGPFTYYDKIPLKQDFDLQKVRVVPPAVARYGAYIAPSAVLMPSYVNIGAYVGAGTMVDTWATVGSCPEGS